MDDIVRDVQRRCEASHDARVAEEAQYNFRRTSTMAMIHCLFPDWSRADVERIADEALLALLPLNRGDEEPPLVQLIRRGLALWEETVVPEEEVERWMESL